MSIFLRILAVIIFFAILAQAAMQLTCSSWPVTKGEILRGAWASEQGDGEQRNFGVYQCQYEYTVNFTKYSNSWISFNPNKTTVKILNDEDQIERQPRIGDTVNVYYLSFYPSISVLIPEVSPTLWLWGVISALAIGGLLAWARILYNPVI
jgi:hypothetical protein